MVPSDWYGSYYQATNTLSTTYYVANPYGTTKKKETKKEKIIRISKERMYASWKVHNEKPFNIIEVKQVCKPRHKIMFR